MYIQRNLSKSLTTFKGLHFPYTSTKRSTKRYHATIGIGGNMGDTKRRFEHLFVSLQKDARVDVLATSLILKNPPFGYLNQDDFFNSIIVLQTNMRPQQLLTYLLRIEKKFQRKRSFADAPRTLDLDIVFFNNEVLNTPTLCIPHKGWNSRESVLIPLVSMAR